MSKQKTSGGGKKLGRNASRCKMYRDRGIREKNKKRKLLKHIAWQPNDNVAKAAVDSLYRNKLT